MSAILSFSTTNQITNYIKKKEKKKQPIDHSAYFCNLRISGVYSLAASSGENIHDNLFLTLSLSKSVNKHLHSQRFQILFHYREILLWHMKSSFTAH